MNRSLAVATLVASVCAPILSNAQAWVEIGSSDLGSMSVDLLSIRQQGQYVKAWSRWSMKLPQTSTGYPIFTYQSTKSLHYVDCRASSIATKQFVYYGDPEGATNPVHSISYTDAQLDFQDPIPGSFGQRLQYFVCERSPQSQPKR